ncbi:DUF4129 domain-containing protein [Patulibacter defluvii]|uniref:DUF4129 domain-containing protein n=1 Tax=Patulibacter defluvii TaxID=3095358 RepID=UPI002A751E2D|nr:DUF4129 domain-containing protein [Patulibacter sp. DM4]
MRAAARARPGGRRGLAAAVALLLALAGPAVVAPGPAVAADVPVQAAGDLTPTAAERGEADRLRRTARELTGRGPDARDRGDAIDRLGDGSGGSGWAWRLLAVVVIAALVLLAVRLARRGPRRRPTAVRPAAASGPDLAALDRAADAAEAAGEHERSVVLRFRAGTLRLLDRGLLRPAAARTAGQVARGVEHPAIGPLAADYDRAAYGSHGVDADASRAAREGWRSVLAEHGEEQRP